MARSSPPIWGSEIRRVAVTGAPVETVFRTEQAIARLTMDAESYYFARVRTAGPNQVVRATRDVGAIQELGAFQGGQLHKLGRYLYVVGGDVFQLDTEQEPAWVDNFAQTGHLNFARIRRVKAK